MAAIDHKVIEDAASDAFHKVITLQGMVRSERGRQKTAVILGLLDSLEEDVSDIDSEVMEARRLEIEEPYDDLAISPAELARFFE